MKTILHLLGKVTLLETLPKHSFVLLINQKTNEHLESSADTAKLLEAGIDHVGCEFEIIIQENLEGKMEPILRKLESKPISKEHTENI